MAQAGKGSIGQPSGAIERPRQAEVAGHPAGKHDGLKGLPQHQHHHQDAGKNRNRIEHRVLSASIRLHETEKELSFWARNYDKTQREGACRSAKDATRKGRVPWLVFISKV